MLAPLSGKKTDSPATGAPLHDRGAYGELLVPLVLAIEHATDHIPHVSGQ
jgi:hypothetical protein